MKRTRQAYIEILKCKHCGRLELSVSDMDGSGLRLGGHKCAGAWDVVKKALLTKEEFYSNSSLVADGDSKHGS